MAEREKLIRSFQTTNTIVGKFAEGLTHEDSIAKPDFRGNSFNWVLGHMLVGRNRVLGLLNQEPVLTAAEVRIYDTGSGPLDGSTASELSRLIAALEDSLQAITAGLRAAPDDEIAAVYNQDSGQTVAEHMAGLHWHETYHLGQLEILRQVNRELPAFP